MADEKETVILEFQVDTKDAIVSIDNLTKANKELREERKKLDTSTAEGQARIKEINSQLDKNTTVIKDNVSALEKQKINIGNYSGALDKLVPGLGSTVNGIKASTTAALEFIATPIGAVIGALGLAIGALTAYFKGSEEGQDRFAKLMEIGKVAVDNLILVVEKLGEVIADTLDFVGNLAKQVIDFVAPSIGKMLDDTIKAGAEIADLQDKIEQDENKLIVSRAETNKKVSELRERALKEEGDQKRRTIQEAINLEKSLADEETKHAQDKLKHLELEVAQTGAATEEQKKQLAELTAEVINQESQRAEATLKFTKQIEKLKDEQDKADQKRIEENLNRIQKYQDQVNQGILYEQDLRAQARQEQFDADAQYILDAQAGLEQLEKEHQKENDAEVAAEKRAADAKKALAKSVLDAKKEHEKQTMALIQVGQNVLQGLFGQSKEVGAAEAILNGIKGFMQAVGAYPPPFGEILGAVSLAAGVKSAAQIEGLQFAQGGYTGQGNPRDLAGQVHKNEFVMPSNIVDKFGIDHFQSYLDGSIVANSSTNSGGSQSPIEVNLGFKEFNEAQNKVKLKDAYTSR